MVSRDNNMQLHVAFYLGNWGGFSNILSFSIQIQFVIIYNFVLVFHNHTQYLHLMKSHMKLYKHSLVYMFVRVV